MVYYNELDPFAAGWLRELIADGLIAPGDVDTRSILEVSADDVRGYTQAHFFAGIGGWSYALRLAGWADDRPGWTGSCPCHPFSAAGTRQGGADPRHLWPHWARLIRQCRPVTIFGEQVESAIAHGWFDTVFDDLEREDYACGAACLPALSVGAPHIRYRLWFVAESECRGGDLADADQIGRARPGRSRQTRIDECRGLGHGLGHAGTPRLQRREPPQLSGAGRDNEGRATREPGDSFWAAAEWLPCRDGKARPAQPGIFPLAHGVPSRVGLLRGAGNAIVPQVAAEVIAAFLDLEAGR